MEPNRLSTALVLVGAALVPLSSSGCASRLTDSSPVVVSTATLGAGSPEPAYESDRTGLGERRPSRDPVADRSDPVSVARAFVTVATNRREGETAAEWRGRLRQWATATTVDSITVRAGNPTFDAEVDRRRGVATGLVVGDATLTRDDTSATVVVVVDETLVFAGQPLDVENFVTWTVTLDRVDDGWRVSTLGFGSRS